MTEIEQVLNHIILLLKASLKERKVLKIMQAFLRIRLEQSVPSVPLPEGSLISWEMERETGISGWGKRKEWAPGTARHLLQDKESKKGPRRARMAETRVNHQKSSVQTESWQRALLEAGIRTVFSGLSILVTQTRFLGLRSGSVTKTKLGESLGSSTTGCVSLVLELVPRWQKQVFISQKRAWLSESFPPPSWGLADL